MLGAAFLMGLIGSTHCIGMCGPLAIVANRMSSKQGILNALIYNGLRISVYILLGVAFGLLGQVALVNGLQKWLSVVLGVGIILLALTMVFKPRVNQYLTGQFGFVFELLSRLNRNNNRGLKGTALLGLVNGFLPCGLVYMAIAGAIVQPTLFGSAFFMAAFGLGTLPMMFTLSFSGQSLLNLIRGNYRKVLSFGLFAFGLFLLYRGLGMEFTGSLTQMLDPTGGVILCK